MNRNTLLVGCNNGLYVYDLSLLYRLFDMTLAQAEECWKVLEKVVDREKAILGLEDTMKLIEQYRLAQDKLQEFWPAIEKILAEESI